MSVCSPRVRAWLVFFVVAHGSASAQTPGAAIWNDLTAAREALTSVRQEFEVRESFGLGDGRAIEQRLTLDLGGRRWREEITGPFASSTRTFDGSVLLATDANRLEFVRTTPKAKDGAPLPPLYRLRGADWSRATERERGPCEAPREASTCVVIDAPLRTVAPRDSRSRRTLEGSVRATFDVSTGLLIAARATVQAIESPFGIVSQSVVTYRLTEMAVGRPVDQGLFTMSVAGMQSVKRLSPWDASKMKKRLVGRPAPPLIVKDISGRQIDLAALKGKTVLLDFWTTWCPPCITDGPALDKLHRRYGQDALAIVGISVSEDREVVERFLRRTPRAFPVVLTTENSLPPQYQISVYPTYVVISPDGTFTSVIEGGRGYGEIEKQLKKAGLAAN